MIKHFVLKILISGEGGVGKTTLLHRYINGKFSAETQMTKGVDFFLKHINVDGKNCALQLWDFGDQKRFRFLIDSYVRGAKGALLMFDLTRIITLNNVEQWVKIVRKYDQDLPILFLGAKCDLINEIEVDDKFANIFKDKYKLLDLIRVSSKTGENVHESFEILTKKILKDKFYC